MNRPDAVTLVAAASTFLFVPGMRADRYDKAVATGADVVIVDLEDAVTPGDKLAARSRVGAWLSAGGSAAVRVNGVDTPWFRDDLSALDGATAVVLPKCESADDVRRVRAAVDPEMPVLPIIETPKGLLAVEEIACAGVVRLAFGNVDLAAELGVDPASHLAFAAARSRMVYASGAAGIAGPVDGVTTDTRSVDSLERDARHARELGFTGKLLIHPRHVAVTARLLEPSADELSWARSVLESTSGAVGLHGGHMVDAPVLKRARRLLDRAHGLRATGTSSV